MMIGTLNPLVPSRSMFPLALSLSKCVYRLEASLTCGRLRLDRLRTNGNSDQLTTNGNSVKFTANGLSASLETNGVI